MKVDFVNGDAVPWSHQMGVCRKCNLRLAWMKGKLMLRDAHCPNCGRRLAPTTRLNQGAFVEYKPEQLVRRG